MKTSLHLYTKEAKDLLGNCFSHYTTRNPMIVCIALDGELQGLNVQAQR